MNNDQSIRLCQTNPYRMVKAAEAAAMSREQDELREIARHAQAQADYIASRTDKAPNLPKGESRMTHSPSPWRRAGENSGHIWAPDGDGVVQVAIVGAYSSRDILSFNRERWDADARLIAAAPEMLAALERVAEWAEHTGNDIADAKDAVERLTMCKAFARAAISKARGNP